MKNLRILIRETLDSMLTFKGGVLSNPSEYLEVIPRDRVKAMELFNKSVSNASDSSDFSYEYYYESSNYPEGVLVTCNNSGITHLVAHQGNVTEFKR